MRADFNMKPYFGTDGWNLWWTTPAKFRVCFVCLGECSLLFAFTLGIHLNETAYDQGCYAKDKCQLKVECKELKAEGECKDYLTQTHKTSSTPLSALLTYLHMS